MRARCTLFFVDRASRGPADVYEPSGAVGGRWEEEEELSSQSPRVVLEESRPAWLETWGVALFLRQAEDRDKSLRSVLEESVPERSETARAPDTSSKNRRISEIADLSRSDFVPFLASSYFADSRAGLKESCPAGLET